jgi:hypothetical protein
MFPGVWFTARGQAIPIPEMETSHIVNCIRKIQRSRSWRRDQLDRLQLELEIRALEGR